MKKVLCLVLVLMLAIGLAACGKGESSSPANTPAANNETVKPVNIDIAYGPAKGTPFSDGMEYWAKIIEEQSNGAMTLTPYPSDQLGSMKDVFDQALAGSPVITTTDVSFFADMGIIDFAIVQAPYLTATWDEMIALSESDWWQDMNEKVEEKGLKVLATNWQYGERHTITKKPVTKPEDFKGMKIRVPQSDVFVEAFNSMGASGTPMALGEVYTALQQGTIDGLENPLSTIYSNKYHEVAKYLILDSHMKTLNVMAMSKDVFDSLTAEQQGLLIKTAEEAGEYQSQLMKEKDQEYLDLLIAEGAIVQEVDEELFNEFRKAAESFYTSSKFKDWTPGLHETIKGIIAQ